MEVSSTETRLIVSKIGHLRANSPSLERNKTKQNKRLKLVTSKLKLMLLGGGRGGYLQRAFKHKQILKKLYRTGQHFSSP